MSSTMVVTMVAAHGGLGGDTMALMGALAGAGLLLRAHKLLRQGKDAALGKLLSAVTSGDGGGRCGTRRKYDWEMEVLGKPCAVCRDAQVKREFAEDGY